MKQIVLRRTGGYDPRAPRPQRTASSCGATPARVTVLPHERRFASPGYTLPVLARWIALAIPFEVEQLSKNRAIKPIVNRRTGKRGMATQKPKRDKAKAIADLVALESRRTRTYFTQSKVWLDIVVVLRVHNADALNVLDTVADAVARGIGVDDRWFAVRRLDWGIDPDSQPTLYLTVGQEA